MVAALAEFVLHELTWDRMRFRDVRDPRIGWFAQCLQAQYRLSGMAPPKVEQALGSCCPHLPLPPTWDEYVRCMLSSETRRSLGKRLRAVERECRLTWLVGNEILDGQQSEVRNQKPDVGGQRSDHPLTTDLRPTTSPLDTLIRLAALRRPETDENLQQGRRLFEACSQKSEVSGQRSEVRSQSSPGHLTADLRPLTSDLCAVATIWCGDDAVASQGMFIDEKHHSLRVYLSGFDERFARWSPGRVLDAMCIRQAIEQGLADYDFLRGDEPYKFQFGAVGRHNRSLTAVRRNMHTATRIAVSRMRDSLRI